MARRFEMHWSDFGITIPVELNDAQNPKLCEEFWQGLPFETIFAGSMSAGEMFKVPIPFVLPSEPEGGLVYFPDQPVGTVVSLSSLSSILIRYGMVEEPFRLPKLGMVPDSDLPKLKEVAMKIRDAYFFTKHIYLATLRRGV